MAAVGELEAVDVIAVGPSHAARVRQAARIKISLAWQQRRIEGLNGRVVVERVRAEEARLRVGKRLGGGVLGHSLDGRRERGWSPGWLAKTGDGEKGNSSTRAQRERQHDLSPREG